MKNILGEMPCPTYPPTVPSSSVPGSYFNGFGEIPVGSIIPYAGIISSAALTTELPLTISGVPDTGYGFQTSLSSWIPCDGRSLKQETYQELYAVIGKLYGGDETTFNVPNYQGYFFRGLDPNEKDNGAQENRTAYPNGKGGATDPGSIQGDAFLTHEHEYYMAQIAMTQAGSEQVAAATTSTKTPTVGPVDASGGSLGTQVSQYETRPMNIYVNYLIRAASSRRR